MRHLLPIRLSTWFLIEKKTRKELVVKDILVAADKDNIVSLLNDNYYARVVKEIKICGRKINISNFAQEFIVKRIKLNEEIISYGVGING